MTETHAWLILLTLAAANIAGFIYIWYIAGKDDE